MLPVHNVVALVVAAGHHGGVVGVDDVFHVIFRRAVTCNGFRILQADAEAVALRLRRGSDDFYIAAGTDQGGFKARCPQLFADQLRGIAFGHGSYVDLQLGIFNLYGMIRVV